MVTSVLSFFFLKFFVLFGCREMENDIVTTSAPRSTLLEIYCGVITAFRRFLDVLEYRRQTTHNYGCKKYALTQALTEVKQRFANYRPTIWMADVTVRRVVEIFDFTIAIGTTLSRGNERKRKCGINSNSNKSAAVRD